MCDQPLRSGTAVCCESSVAMTMEHAMESSDKDKDEKGTKDVSLFLFNL